MALQVTDQNFADEVEKYDGVAFVDFWAPWCGPSEAMGPIIEELAEDKKDQVKVAKLDVDENPVTAQKFNVMSIPTMIIFKKGEKVDTVIGVHSKEELKATLNKQLA